MTEAVLQPGSLFSVMSMKAGPQALTWQRHRKQGYGSLMGMLSSASCMSEAAPKSVVLKLGILRFYTL